MSIAVVKKGEQLPGGSFFCFKKESRYFLLSHNILDFLIVLI